MVWVYALPKDDTPQNQKALNPAVSEFGHDLKPSFRFFSRNSLAKCCRFLWHICCLPVQQAELEAGDFLWPDTTGASKTCLRALLNVNVAERLQSVEAQPESWECP